MPSPQHGYRLRDGTRVPSVTTIIGRWKQSDALIHWASRIALDPYLELRHIVERVVATGLIDPGTIADLKACLAKPAEAADYKHVRDHAAGIGTIVHNRIDCWIRDKPFDPFPFVSAQIPDPMVASQNGFDAFLQWAGSTSFRLVEGEMQLVSEQHRIGGTPDVVMVRGERAVGDWKTGDLYPEQLLPQLAAYRSLLIENGHDISPGAHAISINKRSGGFVHRYFTPEEMTRGWGAFVLMKNLYDLVKELK